MPRRSGDASATVGPLAGTTTDAPVDAVDSRADDDGTVPDPGLHQRTIEQAIDTGRPTILVVSTPVYCSSRFCGPITETVQAIAQRVGAGANFVHIEVWRNYEDSVLNAGAAEWIYPSEDVEPSEPWMFLIDGSGTVVERSDNVANDAELERAPVRSWTENGPDMTTPTNRRCRRFGADDLVVVPPGSGDDLPAPIVASARGLQLHPDVADDLALVDLVLAFRQADTSPEPCAPCAGELDFATGG